MRKATAAKILVNNALPRVCDTSPHLKRIDPEVVAEALGAEIVEPEALTPHEARWRRIAALRGKSLEDVPKRVLVAIDESVIEAIKLRARLVSRHDDNKDWPPKEEYPRLIDEILRKWLDSHGE